MKYLVEKKTVTVYVTFHVLLRELVQSLIRLRSKFTIIYQYMFTVYYMYYLNSVRSEFNTRLFLPVARKPVFEEFDKARFIPACSATETS